MLKNNQPCDQRAYLVLGAIASEPTNTATPHSDTVAFELERLLGLPRLAALQSLPPRAFALQLRILSADPGCFLTRSNWLLALLGFGNARLVVQMTVTDANTSASLFEKRQKLRHTGANRIWQDYLQDNSATLLKELSAECAYKLLKAFKAELLRSQRLTENFHSER